MKSLGLLLALQCVHIYYASSESEHVLILTGENFKVLNDLPFTLVKFYAPWCGHCKKLAPEWDSAAKTLAGVDKPNTIAKIDCDEHKDVCVDQGVTGYPTLKVFKKGVYDESITIPRVSSAIVKLVLQYTSPAVSELSNEADIKNFINKANILYKVLAFCESMKDDKCKAFSNLSDSERNTFDFAITLNSNADNPDYKNHIVIYQPVKLQNKFESSELSAPLSDLKTMKEFLKSNIPRLVDLRTPDNKDIFVNPLCVAYYKVDYDMNAKHTNFWRNRILKALVDLKLAKSDKIKFAISDKDEFRHEMDEFGFTTKPNEAQDEFKIPPKVGCFGSDDQKYVMETEFSLANLMEFIPQFMDGKIESYSKSEPIPDSNDGLIKVIVNKNFQQEVMVPDKDVLIYFYAPWCGHCKSLEPKFKEAAEKMQGEDVIFAKMDATANDIPKRFEVRGYPTIYWLPKDKKGDKDKPEPYEGSREVDGILKFIAKKATGGLKKDKKPSKSEEL